MAHTMWEPATFQSMVAGTAITPFQFRALIPWTVSLFQDTPWGAHFSLEQLRFGSEWIFTFLLLVVFRAYMAHMLSGRWRPTLATLVLACVLPFHFLLPQEFPFYYVYDIPSVFFFTLGLLLLYRRNWLLFYPVFLLATFNRESTCFLTVVFLITSFRGEWLPASLRKYLVFGVRCSVAPGALGSSGGRTFLSGPPPAQRWRQPRSGWVGLESPTSGDGDPAEYRFPTVLAHCLAQVLIWIAVKVLLSALYPGSPNFNHFTRNIYMLRLPETYPVLLSVFGFSWLVVLAGWRRIQDPFIRRACLVVPLFFGVIFVVGQIRELRLYGEMIPIVLPAAILAGQALLQRGEADSGPSLRPARRSHAGRRLGPE